MSESPHVPPRLDSWKAIADYLQRDVATARRWEKNLALPFHRVGGAGRSVFADPAEIDQWLHRAPPGAAVLAEGHRAESRRGYVAMGLLLALAAVALIAAEYGRWRTPGVDGLNAAITESGLVVRNAAGVEQWRRDFEAGYRTVVPAAPVFVSGSTSPGIYLATSFRARQDEDRVESGSLSLLDIDGGLRHSFSFDDRVSFDGHEYHGPWALTAYAVNESGVVAVTAHDYTWDPGLLTVLDAGWHRRGTFVHAGWIEQVRWLGRDRLVIGGFSNAHDGGMLALLDAAALDGQGPEPLGSRNHCDTCASAAPLKMLIMPRSELNRVSHSPFNRVLLTTTSTGVSAHTVEMPAAGGDAVAIYEFDTALHLVNARFSERYWEMHTALEREGAIQHSRDQCPDRDGPRQVQVWEPASGWRTIRIR